MTAVLPPLIDENNFLPAAQEKLTYQITMLGVPVGNALLEAKKIDGDVRITMKVASNAVLAAFYPVDDEVEIRHIAGNFIVTKIRQQEGSFKSDRGFTLFLRDKSVFWMDRLKNTSIREKLPNADVLDLFSALYYLRKRPLMVGSSELLDVYDSDAYSKLPVEVLRKEQVRLSGSPPVNTLVIKPCLKTDGIFRRTGELLIWLTDDENKVPVKVETRIPLGKVTAELVSAETE